jgi:hypothetical protein
MIGLVGLWYLTPFSAIFQLYRDGQFYWWRTPEYSEKTTDLSQVANILMMILVLCIYMALKNSDIHTMMNEFNDNTAQVQNRQTNMLTNP